MNILIPIAGEDKFFQSEEYFFPKPLVEVAGTPMIELCVGKLMAQFPAAHFIFVVQAEHCRRYSLDGMLRILTEGRCTIVPLDRATRGALCSALMAIDHISLEEPLAIANGDQIVDSDLAGLIADADARQQDAAVITFESLHPRWSFVRLTETALVCEAAEKRVISRNAIAGFYYYRTGKLFLNAALQALGSDSSVGGAYYISQTLNRLILDGCNIGAATIPAGNYHSFYSPQKVQEYERHLQSVRLPDRAIAPAKPATINVVIPMAGQGSRFAKAGYTKPKPFIDVAGRTMIETVMDNLALEGACYILIARRDHIDAEPETVARLKARGDVEIIALDGMTEGTACTVLHARDLIDNSAPLLIANCDQVVDFACSSFISDCLTRGLDGSILCFKDEARDPKWSFAKADTRGLVVQVAEKVAISDLATAGLYLFSKGKDFIAGAVDMIARNERMNGEFYTCPVYNHLVRKGSRIGVYEIQASAMHGLGVPEDLMAYLQTQGGSPRRALA
jgi:NDP-sugar pyrophosphorylase family protein